MAYTLPKGAEITYDLTPDDAKLVAAQMAKNGKTTTYILTVETADGARSAIHVGNFPRFGYVSEIHTSYGERLLVGPPQPLGAAVEEMRERLMTTGDRYCVLHWRDEPGTFRVATYDHTTLNLIRPALTTWYKEDPRR